MPKVDRATACCDLVGLAGKGLSLPGLSQGRAASYEVAWEPLDEGRY
jgi:hypothetical protein